jgi:hypothetical protein
MTYEEAQQLSIFRHDYESNCEEREAWGDKVLTKEEFFKVWNRRNESCDSLKKYFM